VHGGELTVRHDHKKTGGKGTFLDSNGCLREHQCGLGVRGKKARKKITAIYPSEKEDSFGKREKKNHCKYMRASL